MKIKNFTKGIAAVGMAAAAVAGVTPVFAAEDEPKPTISTTRNGFGTAGDNTNEENITYKEGNSNTLHVSYDTNGGTWHDPGDDPAKTTDNGTHKNGTYLVTIPASISWTKMDIGAVNVNASYQVRVTGALESGKSVTLAATSALDLKNGQRADVHAAIAQGKTKWTVDDAFGPQDGSINADGSLKGTNSQDTVTLTGIAKAAGTYAGDVTYTASYN